MGKNFIDCQLIPLTQIVLNVIFAQEITWWKHGRKLSFCNSLSQLCQGEHCQKDLFMLSDTVKLNRREMACCQSWQILGANAPEGLKTNNYGSSVFWLSLLVLGSFMALAMVLDIRLWLSMLWLGKVNRISREMPENYAPGWLCKSTSSRMSQQAISPIGQ